jgi:hypothetical protein
MLDRIPNIVSEHDNIQLVREIIEEEIAKVVWDMDANKAPASEEFSIRFYRSFWVFIKQYLKKILNYTLQKQKLRGAANSTLLALIPKDSNPSNFSFFHPISL